jgi:hypothetical protein
MHLVHCYKKLDGMVCWELVLGASSQGYPQRTPDNTLCHSTLGALKPIILFLEMLKFSKKIKINK